MNDFIKSTKIPENYRKNKGDIGAIARYHNIHGTYKNQIAYITKLAKRIFLKITIIIKKILVLAYRLIIWFNTIYNFFNYMMIISYL